MKKRIVAALLIGMMVLGTIGCGKSTDSADNSTKKQVEDTKEEDENATVEVTLPFSLTGEDAEVTQEDLDQEVAEQGFESAKLNDDGSVTYVMTKKKQQELFEEMKKELDDAIKETVGSEDCPDVTAIEPNDTYTEFTIKTTNTELGMDEQFVAYGFYMYAQIMKALCGDDNAKVYVGFVNADSGEVIDDSDKSNYDINSLLEDLENFDWEEGEDDISDEGDVE